LVAAPWLRNADFTFTARPGIHATLGPDLETVQQSYDHLYGCLLNRIAAASVTPVNRWRWAAARLVLGRGPLPRFRMACAFTVAVSLPQAFLAFVVAGIGPLAGMACSSGNMPSTLSPRLLLVPWC
jgi:hypothetical protein